MKASMKAKNAVSLVLLIFVAASVVYLIASESRTGGEAIQNDSTATVAKATSEPKPVAGRVESVKPSEESVTAPDVQAEPQHKLIAYYFHRTQRCRTCLTIEAYAEEALQTAFPEALESGGLEWHTVNIELPENEHFVQAYELVTSTLVLVDTVDGQQKEWQALHEVWDLVGEKEAFLEYVTREAGELLETGS